MYQKSKKAGTILFSTRPQNARNVAVAGNFNKWTPTPMRRQTDGSYTCELAIAPGRHQYKFVVDNRWVQDSDVKDHAPDGYGAKNSVLVMEKTREFAQAAR